MYSKYTHFVINLIILIDNSFNDSINERIEKLYKIHNNSTHIYIYVYYTHFECSLRASLGAISLEGIIGRDLEDIIRQGFDGIIGCGPDGIIGCGLEDIIECSLDSIECSLDSIECSLDSIIGCGLE